LPNGTPLIVNLDLDAVREVVEAWRSALFVLGALNSSLSGQLNDNSVVRPQLEKLRLLGQQTSTTVLGIGHFRKATAGVDPVDAIGGAWAYTQVVRHALGCAAEDEDNYVLSVIKSNVVSVSGVPSLSYGTISTTVMAVDGGETAVGRIVWQGHSTASVVDLLERSAHDDGDERADAAAWRTDYLGERGGEAPVLELLNEGHQAGFSKDTLKRAKTRAKVRSERVDFGGGGCGGSARQGTKGAKEAVRVASLPSCALRSTTTPIRRRSKLEIRTPKGRPDQTALTHRAAHAPSTEALPCRRRRASCAVTGAAARLAGAPCAKPVPTWSAWRLARHHEALRGLCRLRGSQISKARLGTSQPVVRR
jgi:hypothetical protein